MPQELHVVRCFNCETFQVDIVKKIPKWTCKLCGEKQTLKKVYRQGAGKDCRTFVQNLNKQRISLQDLDSAGDIEREHVIGEQDGEPQVKNKWSEYLVDVNKESDDEGEPSNFTFERRGNKRRKKFDDVAHENTIVKEANEQRLPYSPQSKHDSVNMSQMEEPVTNSNSKWTEFCSENREDKSRKEKNTQVVFNDFKNEIQTRTKILAEDIDLDSLLEF